VPVQVHRHWHDGPVIQRHNGGHDPGCSAIGTESPCLPKREFGRSRASAPLFCPAAPEAMLARVAAAASATATRRLALLAVDDQVEGAIGVGSIGVVSVHPDTLVRLVTCEAAAKGNADLASRFRGDARAADACDVHALADVASEDDLVLTWGEVGYARDVASAHERAVCLDNSPEGSVAAALYAVLGWIVTHSFVKRERFLSSLCVRSILSVRHFDIPFPATWIALGR